MYYVYAIGDPIKIKENDYTECYIGVTNKPLNRWKSGHAKSKYTIGKAIKQNSWTFDENMVIIFSGEAKECFDLEIKLRPSPFIGLNEAKGGKGGHTKYSAERNSKISKALKGIPKTYGDKISISKKLNASSKGCKNSRAIKWILTDADGISYHLHGELFKFCEERMLSANTLRAYLNKQVPEISSNYGISRLHAMQIRNNTTGWCLSKEN